MDFKKERSAEKSSLKNFLQTIVPMEFLFIVTFPVLLWLLWHTPWYWSIWPFAIFGLPVFCIIIQAIVFRWLMIQQLKIEQKKATIVSVLLAILTQIVVFISFFALTGGV